MPSDANRQLKWLVLWFNHLMEIVARRFLSAFQACGFYDIMKPTTTTTAAIQVQHNYHDHFVYSWPSEREKSEIW
jgi:hypothetical protein